MILKSTVDFWDETALFGLTARNLVLLNLSLASAVDNRESHLCDVSQSGGVVADNDCLGRWTDHLLRPFVEFLPGALVVLCRNPFEGHDLDDSVVEAALGYCRIFITSYNRGGFLGLKPSGSEIILLKLRFPDLSSRILRSLSRTSKTEK